MTNPNYGSGPSRPVAPTPPPPAYATPPPADGTQIDAQPDATSAKDKAADIAESGKPAATDVARTAGGAGKDVAHETKQQATDLVAKTKTQVSEQVVAQKSAFVENLRSLGDQLAAMTDHVDESGTAIDLATKARDQTRGAADWLDGHEPDEVLEHLRRLGREHPGKFLTGALIAGVAAGRLTRGVVAEHTGDSPAGNSETGASPTIPPTGSASAAAPAAGPARHEASTFGAPGLDAAGTGGFSSGGSARP
jgi:hypothetical protein